MRRNTRRCNTCRRNGVVKVPDAWVDAATDWYEAAHQGKAPTSTKAQIPLDTFPYPHLVPVLKKLYGKSTFGLKLITGKLPPGVGGDTGYPGAGRSITVRIAANLKRPRGTIRHELRHAVQHLGDMALRAQAGKTRKEMRGRFGRPSPATTGRLRGRKALARSGKKPMSKAAWYYHSPSEYHPHVGDAAAWVVRKLPPDPTTAQINKQVRKAVATKSIFTALGSAAKREARQILYVEVMRLLA
jgi:hypothetical protein